MLLAALESLAKLHTKPFAKKHLDLYEPQGKFLLLAFP